MRILIIDDQKKAAGIYKITFEGDPFKVYVGSSVWLYKRYQNHLSELRRGIHKNTYLQNRHNKKNDLLFEVIALCPPEQLLELEQMVLDEYKASLIHETINVNDYCDRSRTGRRHTIESRMKMAAKKRGVPTGRKGEKYSDALRQKLSVAHTGIPVPNRRKWIVQLDKEGKEVNRFHGLNVASEKTGINRSCITDCVTGRSKTAGSFKWQYLA